MDDARKDRSGEERVVSRGFRCAVGGGARSERVLAGDERVSIETRSAFRGVVPPRERTLSPVRSAFATSPEVEEEPSAFHWMLFLDFFSIKPMPSRTLVMSYIRRFCTCRDSAARFRSIVPSSACSIRVTNFFVSKLSELNAGAPWGKKRRRKVSGRKVSAGISRESRKRERRVAHLSYRHVEPPGVCILPARARRRRDARCVRRSGARAAARGRDETTDIIPPLLQTTRVPISETKSARMCMANQSPRFWGLADSLSALRGRAVEQIQSASCRAFSEKLIAILQAEGAALGRRRGRRRDVARGVA